jgi:hypothetical protein
MIGMMNEDTVPAQQPAAAPTPTPSAAPSDEIRAVAQHRNFAWEVRGVDFNISLCCWKRGEIAKQFEKEFKRRELIAKRLSMPLSPAIDAK